MDSVSLFDNSTNLPSNGLLEIEEEVELMNSIEREDTVETGNVDDLQVFVGKVNAINVGEGKLLLELLYSLPKVNSEFGQGRTKSRILKSLRDLSLLPQSLAGKYLFY
jgi:hypothetical protein